MRKSAGALLAAFALVFVSACGASGGDDASDKKDTPTTAASDETTTTEDEETTTTTEDSSGVDVDEWAEGFCGTFEDWIGNIKEASEGVQDSVQPGDVEGAKEAIIDLFGTASSETQTVIHELETAEAPDIEDGEEAIADLADKFRAFDDALQTAIDEAIELPTDDPAVFQEEVGTLVEAFQTETQAVGESFADLPPEINAAMEDACSI